MLYYSDDNPLEKPDVDRDNIMDKRLLIFQSKIIDINESGTYLVIRADKITPSKGGYYIKSNLCFDIICHQDSRKIVGGDRIMEIIDRLEEVFDTVNFSIGKTNLDGAYAISAKDNVWGGYSVVYIDIDWRNTRTDDE